MLAEEIEHVRSKAKSGGSPAWRDYPGQMRVKTCVRRAMKIFEGASPDLTAILEADSAAMGYIDTEAIVRAPIAMPVALPPPASAESSPAQAQNEPARDAAPQTERQESPSVASGNEVRGVVEKVSVKEGEGKKGPWKKFGILIAGEWYGTFDTKTGEKAQTLKSSGETVSLLWKQDGDYKTAVSIGALERETTGDVQNHGDVAPDDLPYEGT